MTSYTEYRPRLSIEISRETQQRIRTLMPHGTQKIVFSLVIEDLLDLFEKHGSGKVIGAFIQREITLKDLIKTKV